MKNDLMRTRTDSKDLIVGLDVGTSKVVVAVAELLPDSRYQVIGIGQARSEGLRKGVVVNIEATVHSIRRALEEATVAVALEMVGTAQTIFDTTLEYAKQREQFGANFRVFNGVKGPGPQPGAIEGN